MIDLSQITPIEREIIRMMAECDLNITWTARRMDLNRNTIAYHVKEIASKTLKNPQIFYDLVELLEADKAQPVAQYSRSREAAIRRYES